MATIKKGTYRFNDVLTDTSVAFPTDTRSIDFSFGLTVDLTSVPNDEIEAFFAEFVGSEFNGAIPPSGVYNVVANCRGFYSLGGHSLSFLLTDVEHETYAEALSIICYIGTNHERFSVYSEGWEDTSYQTITITEDTEVSEEFYEWFKANSKPVTTTITYNGSTIASLTAGQTATMKCAGMKMESDVVVEAGEGGGITPTGTTVITENGTHDVKQYEFAEVNVESEMPSIDEYFPSDTWADGEYFFEHDELYFTIKYKYRKDKSDPKDIAVNAKSIEGLFASNLADFYAAGFEAVLFGTSCMFIAPYDFIKILKNNPIIPYSFDVSAIISEVVEREVKVITNAIMAGAKTYNDPNVANLETQVTYTLLCEGISPEEMGASSYAIPLFLEWEAEIGIAYSGRRGRQSSIIYVRTEEDMDALLEVFGFSFIVCYTGDTGKYLYDTHYVAVYDFDFEANRYVGKYEMLSKYNEAFEDGKQAEYDAFWDNFQQEGARTDYQSAFKGAWWNDTNFKPKYDIKPVDNAADMFRDSGITDLKSICEEQGITFDFSKVTYSSGTFNNAKITRLPVIDVSNLPNCSSIFNSAKNLVWVDGVILSQDGGQNFGTGTGYNWVLYSIIAHFPILSGLINTNCWLNLPSLDKESIVSAINALSDITSGLSITFAKKAKEAAFTEEEWATLITTKPNWTINLI